MKVALIKYCQPLVSQWNENPARGSDRDAVEVVKLPGERTARVRGRGRKKGAESAPWGQGGVTLVDNSPIEVVVKGGFQRGDNDHQKTDLDQDLGILPRVSSYQRYRSNLGWAPFYSQMQRLWRYLPC